MKTSFEQWLHLWVVSLIVLTAGAVLAATDAGSQTAATGTQTAPMAPQQQTTPAGAQTQPTDAKAQTQTPPAETQPQQTPAETQPQQTPAETQPQQTPAETQPQQTPAETQPQQTPAETQPQQAPAKTQTRTAGAVSDKVFVDSGGTRLYVEIEGSKKNAPVLLFLHEGPGNAIGVLAFEAYPGVELEKNFIVAYLHQRGVLQSPEVPVDSQTLANHIRDVDNVVDYLRKRFGKDRVSLVGHSWGGMLGYLYLAQHSEKIDKFVSIAAPFNVMASQFASYETTLQWARDTNNQVAVDGLVRLGSPPYGTSQEALTRTLWSAEAFGSITKNLDITKVMEFGGFADYDPAWGDRQLEINEAMYAEIQKINVENDVARITTPLLLIAARNDAEVPYFSLKSGFDKWGGRKEFLVFDHSNHILFIDETERFVAEVTRFLAK